MEQSRNPSRAYPFVAYAELTIETSGVPVTARLCELSRQHCRLFVSNPPSPQSSVLVKIYAWPHFFEVHGTVSRSDAKFGIGVEFGEIEPRYISALNACLLEIEQNQSKG
jgi:hypothetical protein